MIRFLQWSAWQKVPGWKKEVKVADNRTDFSQNFSSEIQKDRSRRFFFRRKQLKGKRCEIGHDMTKGFRWEWIYLRHITLQRLCGGEPLPEQILISASGPRLHAQVRIVAVQSRPFQRAHDRRSAGRWSSRCDCESDHGIWKAEVPIQAKGIHPLRPPNSWGHQTIFPHP